MPRMNNICHLCCFSSYRPEEPEIENWTCSLDLKWKSKMFSVGCVYFSTGLLHLVYFAFFQFLVHELLVFESCDLLKTWFHLFYLYHHPCSLIPAPPALSVRYQTLRKCQTLLAAIISCYHHHSTPSPRPAYCQSTMTMPSQNQTFIMVLWSVLLFLLISCPFSSWWTTC